jgi:WD40-like Beta Propeller Repeat
VSTRSAVTDPWRCPVNLGPVLNSSANDLQANFSDDAEVLFFSSNRPGGSGSDDLWMTKREPQRA